MSRLYYVFALMINVRICMLHEFLGLNKLDLEWTRSKLLNSKLDRYIVNY